VARPLLLLLLSGAFLLAQPPKPVTPPDEPPEEDVREKEREYAFNPLQATKEIEVGKFNRKRGNWKGAMMRFDEATKWNPQSAEAWQCLGEAREKLKDKPGARTAYEKYLELAADAKNAGDIRKRLAVLRSSAK
jgi:tetratricopeptide (TPR) repeat protein